MEGIVLLHGILRSRFSFAPLAWYLRRQGFATLNLTYPSRHFPLEQLAERIHPRVEAFSREVDGPMHFVCHSMGGLLTRAYLAKYRPARLGRVVMIATPNQGSEVADYMKDTWFYRKLFGPAGQQLVTRQDSFAAIFGPVDFELGVIACSRSNDPVSSRIINKPNDGKVSIESTKLEGMKDHIVMPASHTSAIQSLRVWRQVLQFVWFGAFAPR